jgi:hypothetical protein
MPGIVVFTGDVVIKGVDTGGVDTKGVDTGGVDTKGVDSKGVDTGDVDIGDVDANGVDTDDVEAKGVDTEDVDADAFIIGGIVALLIGGLIFVEFVPGPGLIALIVFIELVVFPDVAILSNTGTGVSPPDIYLQGCI